MDEDLAELDVTEIERELCRLPQVTIARIVADGIGRITEVHIVAEHGKHPKQIVRDVQSVALASFGIEIDRRVVSVVQLGGEGRPDPVGGAEMRPAIVAITAEASGLRSLVRVTLALGEVDAVGFAEGSAASSSRHRLVAQASIDALRQLEPAAECLDVDHARIVRCGDLDVAVVTVVYVIPPHEQIVSGSAVVRQNQDADAIARAVLDATNRRLTRLPSGT